MDIYTRKAKKWLENQRFNEFDKQGVYVPHQPIYGFQFHRDKPEIVGMYLVTYQVLKALSHIKFKSFLDVGGAEGYTAWLIKNLFDVKVFNADLSEEACRRAEEIFRIKSIPADAHNLPFKEKQFDVVLCSETLEHVSDWRQAVKELLRVAKKAVVITVPHEPQELIEKNRKRGIPHSHRHNFDLDSFNYLRPRSLKVLAKKIKTPWLRKPAVLIEANTFELEPKNKHQKDGQPPVLLKLYNATTPLLKKVLGSRTVAAFIWLDDLCCRLFSSYEGMVFTILKDKRCWRQKRIPNISALRVINLAVPLYFRQRKD